MHYSIVRFYNGRLALNHGCEFCENIPLENVDEPCFNCGISQSELAQVEGMITKVNRYIDLAQKFDIHGLQESDYHNKPVEFQARLTNLNLGDKDSVEFVDEYHAGELRELNKVAGQPCHVVVYPQYVNNTYEEYDDEEWLQDDSEW